MVIEVPFNKSRLIRQLIIFTLAMLLFTFMAIRPELFVKTGTGGFVKVVGYIGSFIFIICTAFVAQKVFNKKPGLILDNEGIVDNSLGVMFAKLYWKQVTAVEQLESEGKYYIRISIKDPEKYIAAEKNPMKRRMLELNYGTLKTPVNIVTERLKINHDELFARIQNLTRDYGSIEKNNPKTTINI
ncbi:MAG: STM3941 family protein [Niabella sp.]